MYRESLLLPLDTPIDPRPWLEDKQDDPEAETWVQYYDPVTGIPLPGPLDTGK